MPHCLSHPHICRLIVEIQKLGQIFLSPRIFLLLSTIQLFMIGRLKCLHLSYKLFSHHAGNETILQAIACGEWELGSLLVMVRGAIDDTRNSV